MIFLRLSLLFLLSPVVFCCYTGNLTKSEVDKNYLQKLVNFDGSLECLIQISGSPDNYKLHFGVLNRTLRYKNVCTMDGNDVICVCFNMYSSDCNRIEWFLTTPTPKMVETPLYKKAFDDLLEKFYPDSKDNYLIGQEAFTKIENTHAEDEEGHNEEQHCLKLRNLITMREMEKPLANMHWSRVSVIFSMVMLFVFAIYVLAVQCGISRKIKRYFKIKKTQKKDKTPTCQPEPEFSCRAPSPGQNDSSSGVPSFGDSGSRKRSKS